MTTQPTALELAEWLDNFDFKLLSTSAAELRRQHSRIEELEAQLAEANRDAAAWREHVEQAKVSYAAFVNGLNKEQP